MSLAAGGEGEPPKLGRAVSGAPPMLRTTTALMSQGGATQAGPGRSTLAVTSARPAGGMKAALAAMTLSAAPALRRQVSEPPPA